MRGSGIVLQSLSVTFGLLLGLNFIDGQSVINIFDVQYKGTLMTSRNGKNISAYRGIPYAQPPVGPLRFSTPRQWVPEGFTLINAVADGNDCPQMNDDGNVVGDEDCLFLNIYTPNPNPKELYPTMVYFHGGTRFFSRGSGSSKNVRPDYLLDRDVVLVTVNYRLGALGFLSTGDNAAPGNFGLRDQKLALEWVQYNIVAFGGHPYRTTIFGHGAGGASVGIHALFEPSKDLFQQYISQSGSALSFWAYQEIRPYRKKATELGNYLKCPTHNNNALVNCLRQAKVQDIVDSDHIFGDKMWQFRDWGPTMEPPQIKGRYITQAPFHQMAMYGTKDCPAILGDVSDEGLLWTAELYANDTLYNIMTKNLFEYLNYAVLVSFTEHDTEYYTRDVEDFYFKGVEKTDKKAFIRNLTNFLTDVAFQIAMDLELRTLDHAAKSPFYAYAFDYRGTFSTTSAVLGNNDNVGVAHGDDFYYLFPRESSNATRNGADDKMVDIMLDFWTSFAHTGIPTSNHTSDPNVWNPYSETIAHVLKIGENSDPTNVREYERIDLRLAFWANLLAKQIVIFLSL